MRKTILLISLFLFTSVTFFSCGFKRLDSTNAKDNNILRVGIDLKFPPFMYVSDNGTPTGLEPDLARAFGKYLEMEIEIVNTDFSMLIPALQTGAIDIIISDISITPERKTNIDFSIPYRYGRTTALVNKDFYKKNKISEQMSAKNFFSIPNANFIGLSGTVGTIIPSHYGIMANEATEIGTALMEITTGLSDVIVGSYVIFGDYNANRDTTELYLGIPDATPSAFAVKKGNTELINQANEFIATLYQPGGLYEQLATKYDDDIHKVFFNDELGLNYITRKPEFK